MQFRSIFGENIFNIKYRHEGAETWEELCKTLVKQVCSKYMSKEEMWQLTFYMMDMKFIPGGRYLYYAGRPNPFFNNCYLLASEEDTREDWADLSWKAESCLTTGGGIGNDYSIYRPEGAPIAKTGGKASGPIPKMEMINEIGRRVMQGGSRRSAIYASLDWHHADINKFLKIKNWDEYLIPGTNLSLADIKNRDFNWPAPLDMTNISINYDDDWLDEFQRTGRVGHVFRENVRQAIKTAEPGFSFNFGKYAGETLRNAPVAGPTWVITSEGPKQVSTIVGEEQLLWTGKQWAPATFVKTKKNTPTVRVRMTGDRSIITDPEHEFFVERWVGKGKARRRLKSIDKVRADTLQVGDVLHVSLPKPEYQDREDDRAYIRGYAFGDGSFSPRGSGRAEITFCTEAAQECFWDLDRSQFSHVLEKDGRGYIRAFMKDDWYINQHKDVFPELEFHETAAFMAGLFDADGSYDAKNNRVRLSSKHYAFLAGARRALETLGIQSSITRGGVSTYGGALGYLLVVMSNSITRFGEIIPTKRFAVKAHTPYRDTLIRVLSVEPDENRDVYCCDVGAPEHSFCAEGVIISNCTEVTSSDDSDVCNLGSLNLSRIESIREFQDVAHLATKFLLCGTLEAKLPYAKVAQVREKNRRLGLGLMGVHEWLVRRNYRYEVTPELHDWLKVYKDESDKTSLEFSAYLDISCPVANRAIAPTGTIGILAGTTTGIEPILAVAYKRRYLKNGTEWHYQYVVDSTAKGIINEYDVDPESIETAMDLAVDVERRIKFQADVQDYVDMAISSTINLPSWGSPYNNEDTVDEFATILAHYAPRLRGGTFYPDGARGGQPITAVPFAEAISKEGDEYAETTLDVCDLTKGGYCGS